MDDQEPNYYSNYWTIRSNNTRRNCTNSDQRKTNPFLVQLHSSQESNHRRDPAASKLQLGNRTGGNTSGMDVA